MKLAVYALVRVHPSAAEDVRFRAQLFDAAASVEMNIAEGWRRHNAGEFSQFLRYSRASDDGTVEEPAAIYQRQAQTLTPDSGPWTLDPRLSMSL